MRMLNIACGSRYHKDWTNIDFHADSEAVQKVNILSGLPFQDASFDVVYSSHFIEHISPSQADTLLIGIHRILKKNGIIRLATPDLENICREYLALLEGVRNNTRTDEYHEYIVVELLDQMVRTKPGGKLGEIFKTIDEGTKKELKEYICKRTGKIETPAPVAERRRITLSKITNRLLYKYLQFIKLLVPKGLRENVFCGTTIGELHKWMYDSHSLSRLLAKHGFLDIRTHSHTTSSIPNFNDYLLDITPGGEPYKGNSSLFIEGRK